MSRSKIYLEGYTQNRELSWLRFNERVLDETTAKENPLLERLKFVSIHQSNLDEFFAVRCGSLLDLNKLEPNKIDSRSGYDTKTQLELIYKEAHRQINKRNRVLHTLRSEMLLWGISDLAIANCTKEEKRYLRNYFNEKILPKLNPQIVDIHHPFPVFPSGSIQIAGIFRNGRRYSFAFVAVPITLTDIIMLPGSKVRYVHTEDLILKLFPTLFKDLDFCDILKFRVIRSAQILLDDILPDEKDYRKKMSKYVKQRQKLKTIRLDVSKKPDNEMKKYLLTHLKIDENCMFIDTGSFNTAYGFAMEDLLKKRYPMFFYDTYEPKLSPDFDYNYSIFDQVQDHNVVLNYPYNSMDPFLLLIKQAASDPSVTKIQMTIYRLAKNSKIVDYLCMAAAEGKQVDVLIELKARFDEQNNIVYSSRLEEAGVQLYFGFEQYKVHSKIALITRKCDEGEESVCLIATGNFNEKSARTYTDLAFMSAEEDIILDARNFFYNMKKGILDGDYRTLWVAPVSLKQLALKKIKQESAKGSDGRIILKMNSLTDVDLMMALKEASCRGVKIDLIVRGICCLLPGIEGKTENIRVISIVGRYLEHSRVYVFGKGADQEVYIASADFMSRNTEHRVEIAVPVRDEASKLKVLAYLEVCLKDNVKARLMSQKGKYNKLSPQDKKCISQEVMMEVTPLSSQCLPMAHHHEPIAAFPTVYIAKKEKNK